MARGDQLGRQWKIIQTLVASQAGKSVPDLAETLACTSRTIYRDLEALQVAGFPITTESRNNRSYWRILNPGRQQVPLTFTIPELMALYFGRDMLRTYRGTVFHDAIESLLSKIKATLAPGYVDYLDRIQSKIVGGPVPRKDYARFAATIKELNRAIIEAKKIQIHYFSMGRREARLRTVHPYGLRHVEDSLYLIGYCDLRKNVRTFAVDRIKSATATDSTFRVPSEFDLKAFLQDSFGIFQGPAVKVEIRFLKSVAGYIRERTWHKSQRIEEQTDGSLIFSATVAGIEEIGYWVLRWGASAQVLAPDSLRQSVRRHAESMAAYYHK